MPSFNYISPLIYPLFPRETGRLFLDLDVQAFAESRISRSYKGPITLRFDVYSEGELKESKVETVQIARGAATPDRLSMVYSVERPSYLELSMTAPEAVFDRILVTARHAVLERHGQGVITIAPDAKYANDWIVQQIESLGKFCLIHTASYIDPAARIGQSMLLINPYDQTIVARLSSSSGKQISHKVPSKCFALVELDKILLPGVADTVMVTGNNRLAVWDVRHVSGAPLQPNSIDHMHIYSGFPAIERVPAGRWMRGVVRRALRTSGLRNR